MTVQIQMFLLEEGQRLPAIVPSLCPLAGTPGRWQKKHGLGARLLSFTLLRMRLGFSLPCSISEASADFMYICMPLVRLVSN